MFIGTYLVAIISKSDIKPENILYESSKPNALLKIVDFGTSRFYDPDVKMD